MSANFLPNYPIVVLQMIAVMIVWPRMVFWKYLRGKSAAYQLGFCLCSSIVVTSIGGLLLGSLNFLYGNIYAFIYWAVFAGFFIAWVVSFVKNFKNRKKDEPIEIPFVTSFLIWLDNFTHNLFRSWKYSKKYWIELILNLILIALVVWIVWYMGHDIRVKGQYIFSDTVRHEKMVQQMLANNLYAEGVYPYGLHLIIYTAVTCLGANLYNFNMYCGNMMCLAFLVALYFWLKTIFKNKVSAVLVIALFLVTATCVLHFKADDRMVFDGLHRLRYSLPEEFCMFAMFIAPICITKIMRSDLKMRDKSTLSSISIFLK